MLWSKNIFCVLLLSLSTLHAMEDSSDGLELNDSLDHAEFMQQLYGESIISAAEKNDVAHVKEQIAQGARINIQSIDTGSTPLLAACAHTEDTLTLVTVLLQAKADPNLADHCLHVPIHYAAYYNKVPVLDLLKKAGALLNMQNNAGFTPCHFAVQKDALEAIVWLHAAGAHMNITNNNGEAPIHAAVLKGNSKAVMQLLKCGAKLYAISKPPKEPSPIPHGSTPFHLAARNMSAQGYAIKSILLYYALLHGSKYEQTGVFEAYSLNTRVENLTHAFNHRDSNHQTPYEIELRNTVSTEQCIAPLFKDTLKLDMYNFQEALKNSTLASVAATNIFKAAYDAMPKKQTWGSYLASWVPWK